MILFSKHTPASRRTHKQQSCEFLLWWQTDVFQNWFSQTRSVLDVRHGLMTWKTNTCDFHSWILEHWCVFDRLKIRITSKDVKACTVVLNTLLCILSSSGSGDSHGIVFTRFRFGSSTRWEPDKERRHTNSLPAVRQRSRGSDGIEISSRKLDWLLRSEHHEQLGIRELTCCAFCQWLRGSKKQAWFLLIAFWCEWRTQAWDDPGRVFFSRDALESWLSKDEWVGQTLYSYTEGMRQTQWPSDRCDALQKASSIWKWWKSLDFTDV